MDADRNAPRSFLMSRLWEPMAPRTVNLNTLVFFLVNMDDEAARVSSFNYIANLLLLPAFAKEWNNV